MIKKMIILLFLSIATSLFSTVNDKYISVEITSRDDISILTKLVSIDKREGNTIYAYALPEEIVSLKNRGIAFEVLTHTRDRDATLTMATDISQMSNWDRYPTYDVYIELMNSFATNYPELCSIQNIGYSQENREIPVVKITNNVSQEATKPAFYYSGQMHGDELVCYILLLRLIDELLTNYGTDTQITNLLNNTEIWINPLSNPDGTYYGGNNTVTGARRYFANYRDPNRNFIDFITGEAGDGYTVSQENLDQIAFMTGKGFVMSCNTHSGAELVNYPWDTKAELHPDDTWFQQISHVYTDAVHEVAPSSYMNVYDDGVTNGYAWYEADGSRQDYANYYLGIREITVEQSMDKMVDVSELDNYWTYNRDALIALIEQVQYGIRGVVVDYEGTPLNATIEILEHDTDVTKVKSNPDFGDYYRPINPGTYDIQISVSGYDPQIFTDVTVIADSYTTLNATFGQPDLNQNIQINSGWNLISYNLELTDTRPETMLSDVLSNILEVKNLTDSYSPTVPYYFNTLANLIPEDGYWVNVSENSSLQLTGEAYDSSTEIALNSGWNLIGYLPQAEVAPQDALQSIDDKLIQVKSLTTIYKPDLSDVFNTMDVMSSNKGYWVEVSEDCNLIYNESRNTKTFREETSPWEIIIYPNNTAVIYAEFSSNVLDVQHNQDYLGVFADGECLGASVFNLYSDGTSEKSVAVIVMQMPNSQQDISFAYYQAGSGETISLNQQMQVNSGQTYGEAPNDLTQINYFITENESHDIESIDDLIITTGANPFHANLEIKIESKKEQDVQVELYNLKGQKVASEQRVISPRKTRSIGFNTEYLASGIYFVKVKSCGKISTLKVLKIK